jgi:hypothetical protein
MMVIMAIVTTMTTGPALHYLLRRNPVPGDPKILG